MLDYIPGGELFTLMRKEIKFSPSNAKFYIAQIIDALDSLHRNKIIYRDLKPENLLIDVDGYLKIVDFGVAKQIENRTNTLAGTPTYMAPEIVNKENYSFEVDWWSLGILTYEMTVGLDPWDENDTFKIYEKIKKGMILFPKNMDKKLKNFIQHLLIGDPKKRMGSFINDKTTDKENKENDLNKEKESENKLNNEKEKDIKYNYQKRKVPHSNTGSVSYPTFMKKGAGNFHINTPKSINRNNKNKSKIDSNEKEENKTSNIIY